jgi:hypothetical protein
MENGRRLSISANKKKLKKESDDEL